MSFLNLSQLFTAAEIIIGQATHPSHTHEFIKNFRGELSQAIQFCNHNHSEQEKQKNVEEHKKLQSDNNTNEVQ